MKIREVIIDTNWPLLEMVYPGNLGLMELAKFYRIANPEQKTRMEEITKTKDWDAFKEIVFEVLGVKLI